MSALDFRLKAEATSCAFVPRTPVASAFRRKAAVVAIVLAVVGTTAARKPKTYTVTIDAAQFSPAELTVAAGDTVVWVNKDILAHTATAKSKGFDSTTIQPGKSWKFFAKQKGEYPYTCSFHPMNGVLRVR